MFFDYITKHLYLRHNQNNNMKRISLLFLSIFALQVANAQVKKSDEFDFTISDPYKVVDGNKIYFSKGDEVLSIKIVRGGYVLQIS